MKLRRCNSLEAMGWMYVCFDYTTNQHEVTWCASEEEADKLAEYDLSQATQHDYKITVYTLKCLKIGGHHT